MTVLNPAHAAEMFTTLRRSGTVVHHLVLHTAPPVLLERIDSSWEYPGDAGRSEAVRVHQRRRAVGYHEAAAWLHTDGHVIDTTMYTTDQTLQAALALLHTIN
ncbi:hypothetical protein [Streptomyces sp. NBC_00057]|uniref:hypothetical protein n=1 Tax=Streptomyces sp. NBC_00057 TaxID=2975634 RepID=UPI003246D25B